MPLRHETAVFRGQTRGGQAGAPARTENSAPPAPHMTRLLRGPGRHSEKRARTLIRVTPTLFANATFHTLNPEAAPRRGPSGGGRRHRGGRLGSRTPSPCTPGTRTVDLDNAVVIPGLTDAHIHTASLARSMHEVDLRQAGSLAEALAGVGAVLPRYRDGRVDFRRLVGLQQVAGPGPAGPHRPGRGLPAQSRGPDQRGRPHGVGQLARRCSYWASPGRRRIPRAGKSSATSTARPPGSCGRAPFTRSGNSPLRGSREISRSNCGRPSNTCCPWA